MKTVAGKSKYSFMNPQRFWGGNVEHTKLSLLNIEEQHKLSLIGCSIVESEYEYSTILNERLKKLPHYQLVKETAWMTGLNPHAHLFNLTQPIFFSKIPGNLHTPHYGC
jgi:hypothetical protein